MQDFIQVRLESAAFDPAAVQVAELKGHEAISRLYEFELRIATQEGAIDEDKLMTSAATIIFSRRTGATGEPKDIRKIPGMVRAVVDRALSEANHREYVVTIVPFMWQATLWSTSDVCMATTVPEIIQQKLNEANAVAPNADLALRTRATYPQREFVVQYKESNFDFVCRLAEDMGIHFSFDEADGRELIIFADDNTGFGKAAPDSTHFSPRGEHQEVYHLEARRQLVSTNFVARDYNYRNPSMDVLGEAKNGALGSGKVDDYGPHAKTPEEATTYARLRSEEAAWQALTFEGKSDLPGLRAGSIVKIDGHPRGELDLLITELTHAITQPAFGHTSGKEHAYSNTFRAILKATPYRPLRLTPKPRVSGVLTGVVESEAASDLGAIDDQGRYRVAFMFDSVTGRGDGKASRPLRMAQPSAGSQRGFHQPLKSGTEVIITCVNGDPDRPIIAGAVPNPQTPSPVSSANSEKSMWTTNVNSIAIDDKNPRCKMSVNGEDHVFQMGAPNGPEFGMLMGTVGNAASMANGASTMVSKTVGAYQEYKSSLSKKSVVNMAGTPHPWGLWEKIDAVVDGLMSTAKAVSGIACAPMKIAADNAAVAKKAADEKLKEVKKERAKKLGLKPEPKPKDKPNDDGTPAMETEGEAMDRELNANKDKDEKSAKELEEADKEAAKATEESTKATEALESSWMNAEAGKVGAIMKTTETVVAAAKAVGAVKKLYSDIVKHTDEIAQKAAHVMMCAAQDTGLAAAELSHGRKDLSPHEFEEPFNVQGATNSTGIYAIDTLVMFGGKEVTMYSPGQMAVVGGHTAQFKSKTQVEVSSKDVFVSASESVDIKASKKIKLIAHADDLACPDGFSMLLNSHQGIMIEAEDKDIQVTAKKNFKLEAKEENIELKTKKTFKLDTEENDILVTAAKGKIEVTAAKGKIEIVATEGKGALRAKEKVVLQCTDGDFTLVSDKAKGTVKASKELNLESKSGQWKTSGDVEFKVKNFTVNGSKVLLG